LRDLRLKQEATGTDQRPFDGPLTINRAKVSATSQTLVEQELGIATQDISQSAGPPVTHPGQLSSYQLYPGGTRYQAELLSGAIANQELGPNVVTNPLGLFVCTDELRLLDNVTIEGTVLTYRASTAGDIRIQGDNVTLRAPELPLIDGEATARQLPVAIVNNDFEIDGNSSGSLSGVAVTFDDFRFNSGDMATTFTVDGKLIVSELQLQARTQWAESASWWNERMSDFMRSINANSPANSRFPDWLASQMGLDSTPRFLARPATGSPKYYWHDWSEPLFIAHPHDQGLRWDLVEWDDSP